MSDGKVVIGTEVDTKTFDKQIKYLENKLEEIESTLGDQTIEYELRLKNEAEAEKIRNQLVDIKEKTKDVRKETNRTASDGAKSLKRFALSLFSVGSLFALVSKASSSYLSVNDELANKLKSVWVGLGSFLAPVIEMISDVLLTGLGYLNEFIKALTGVDYIARANAKALEKQTKSQNKLNKATQQYDFDVIRKQQSTTTSDGATGGTSGLVEIPQLNEGIVKRLQDLATWLKENWNWIWKVGAALGAVFGISKISGIVKNLGLLIGGSSSGLLGVTSLLKGLATIGIIAIGIDLIYKSVTGRSLFDDLKEIVSGINEVKNAYKTNADAAEKSTKKIDSVTNAFAENVEAGKYTEDQMNKIIGVNKTLIENLATQTTELKKNTNWWNIGSSDARRQMKENVKQIEILTGKYGDLYDQGLLNEGQAKQYYDMLYMQIGLMNDLGEDTIELKKKYEELTGQKYEIVLEAKAKENVSSLLDKMSKVFPMLDKYKDIFAKMNVYGVGGGGYSYGSGSGGGTRGYDYGYAYGGIVTQPTRALIGEAGYNEYILPEREDYLSRLASLIGQYSGGGQSVNNIYLDSRLLQRQISNKQGQVNFATNK